MAFEALGVVLLNTHYGAGHSRGVMVISLCMQWCLFLPIALGMQSLWSLGLLAIWIANVTYRILQSATFVWSWETGSWAQLKV